VSPRTVRRLVIGVFVIGIGGMIAGSIADNNGFAITFGLITAAAAVGLILVTAVAPPGAFGPAAGQASRRRAKPHTAPVDEGAAALVEEQVSQLVSAGADEGQVRELVRRAVTLGRRSR
jgi:hypothetical protein